MTLAANGESTSVPTRRRRVIRQLQKILPSDRICIQQHFPRFYAKCRSLKLIRESSKNDAVSEDPDVLKEAILQERHLQQAQSDPLSCQFSSVTDKKRSDAPVRKLNLVVQCNNAVQTHSNNNNDPEVTTAHGFTQLPSLGTGHKNDIPVDNGVKSETASAERESLNCHTKAEKTANRELNSTPVSRSTQTKDVIRTKRPCQLSLSPADLKPYCHSTDLKPPTESTDRVSTTRSKFSVTSLPSPLIQRALISPGNYRRSSCGPSFLGRSNLGHWRSSLRPKTAKSSPPTPTAHGLEGSTPEINSTATLDLSSHLATISLQRGCWLRATLSHRSRSPGKDVESSESVGDKASKESSPIMAPRVIFLHRKRSPTESVSRLELAKEILQEFERQKCGSVPNIVSGSESSTTCTQTCSE